MSDNTLRLLQIVATLVAPIIVYIQLRTNVRIAKADFLNKLNSAFKEHLAIYKKYAFGNTLSSISIDDEVEMAQCLSFFELIYLLISKKRIITFNEIDDLFGNRFFNAVSNPISFKIISEHPQAFKNIFFLYYDWKNYRIKKGNLPIPYFSTDKSIELIKSQ